MTMNGNGTPSGTEIVEQVVDDICAKAKAAVAAVTQNMIKALDDLIAHAKDVQEALRARQAAVEASIDHAVALTADATKTVGDGRKRLSSMVDFVISTPAAMSVAISTGEKASIITTVDDLGNVGSHVGPSHFSHSPLRRATHT